MRITVAFLRMFRSSTLIIIVFSLFGVGCRPFTQVPSSDESSTHRLETTIDQQNPFPSMTPGLAPTQMETKPDSLRTLPPLYLTIIIHNEEDVQAGTQPKEHIPDYDGDEVLMLYFTKAMRAFAAMAGQHGAK